MVDNRENWRVIRSLVQMFVALEAPMPGEEVCRFLSAEDARLKAEQ